MPYTPGQYSGGVKQGYTPGMYSGSVGSQTAKLPDSQEALDSADTGITKAITGLPRMLAEGTGLPSAFRLGSQLGGAASGHPQNRSNFDTGSDILSAVSAPLLVGGIAKYGAGPVLANLAKSAAGSMAGQSLLGPLALKAGRSIANSGHEDLGSIVASLPTVAGGLLGGSLGEKGNMLKPQNLTRKIPLEESGSALTNTLQKSFGSDLPVSEGINNKGNLDEMFSGIRGHVGKTLGNIKNEAVDLFNSSKPNPEDAKLMTGSIANRMETDLKKSGLIPLDEKGNLDPYLSTNDHAAQMALDQIKKMRNAPDLKRALNGLQNFDGEIDSAMGAGKFGGPEGKKASQIPILVAARQSMKQGIADIVKSIAEGKGQPDLMQRFSDADKNYEGVMSMKDILKKGFKDNEVSPKKVISEYAKGTGDAEKTNMPEALRKGMDELTTKPRFDTAKNALLGTGAGLGMGAAASGVGGMAVPGVGHISGVPAGLYGGYKVFQKLQEPRFFQNKTVSPTLLQALTASRASGQLNKGLNQ